MANNVMIKFLHNSSIAIKMYPKSNEIKISVEFRGFDNTYLPKNIREENVDRLKIIARELNMYYDHEVLMNEPIGDYWQFNLNTFLLLNNNLCEKIMSINQCEVRSILDAFFVCISYTRQISVNDLLVIIDRNLLEN
jgi:hypothetical protein